MLPRLAEAEFGFLDDGRAISVAEAMLDGNWDYLDEDYQRGRSRPLYWIAFGLGYALVGGQPAWFFLGNTLVLAGTVWILIRLVLELGGSDRQAWSSGLFYALSGPIIENFYTLGKGETWQVLLMAAALLLAVLAVRAGQAQRAAAVVVGALLILAACLIKETTLALIPISLAWWALAWLGRWRRLKSATTGEMAARLYALASLAGGGLFFIWRSVFLTAKLAGVGYTARFVLEAGQLFNGLVRWGGWLLRDDLWLVPLGLLILAACAAQRRWLACGLGWFAGIWMAAWLAIFLPWDFVVGYYLLPFAAGAAVLAGLLFDETWRLLVHPHRTWRAAAAVALVVAGVLLLGSLANNAATASIQLAQDTANAAMLRYVAENAPPGSAVIVNIQLPNEYVVEMQLLLADLYDRPDLDFNYYQQQDFSQMSSEYPAVYLLVPELENQPHMTVRMGLQEENQQIWNASIPPVTPKYWQTAFQVSRQPPLLTVDYPRLLCSIIYRENYCSAEGGLVYLRQFRYQWAVYLYK
jgi:hypothetical protein